MRLRDSSDKLSFLIEVDRVDLLDQEIPDELFEKFIKQRKEIVPKLKEISKSQAQRRNWRVNRRKIMKGIRKFHRSTKGKKFHRQLGRFLANRSVIPKSELFKNRKSKRVIFGENIQDLLTAISSVRTHLYIDLGYYKTLDEEVEYNLVLDEVLPTLDSVERKLRLDEDIDELEYETLLRLIDSEILEELFNVKIDEDKLEEDLYLSKLIYKL